MSKWNIFIDLPLLSIIASFLTKCRSMFTKQLSTDFYRQRSDEQSHERLNIHRLTPFHKNKHVPISNLPTTVEIDLYILLDEKLRHLLVKCQSHDWCLSRLSDAFLFKLRQYFFRTYDCYNVFNISLCHKTLPKQQVQLKVTASVDRFFLNDGLASTDDSLIISQIKWLSTKAYQWVTEFRT